MIPQHSAIGKPLDATHAHIIERTGARKRGDQWQGTCPCHDDRKASLSIAPISTCSACNEELIKVDCLAGCDTEHEIMPKLGLRPGSLGGHAPNCPYRKKRINGNGHARNNGHINGARHFAPTTKAKQKHRIVEAYPYRDEAGVLLYENVRYEPKKFLQRRSDGRGGHVWNLDGVRRVPYRLPELLAEPLTTPVHVTEGEKDCDRLRALGLCATTNSAGAGQWSDEFNEFLRGRPVVLSLHNDKSGRERGVRIARALMDVAASVHVLEFRELPEKADVSDWLDLGHSKDELLERVAHAPDAATWLKEFEQAEAGPPQHDDDDDGDDGHDDGHGGNVGGPEAKSWRDELRDFYLAQSADDEGNAQSVAEAAQGRILHVKEIGWMRYVRGHWTTERADIEVDRTIVRVLTQRRLAAVSANVEAIVKCSKADAHRVKACKALLMSIVGAEIADFDRDPDALNVANGVLNLRTLTLTPHSPEQRFTYCLKVPYDPEADYSRWEAFLRASVARGDDPATMAYLKPTMGYWVTGRTSEEKAFHVSGATRSGKGTMSEILQETLGPLVKATSFATFTKPRGGDDQGFDLAPLKSARLVIAEEPNANDWLNAGKVKELTGGGSISCAFKGKNFFTYKPQWKPVLISNHPVNADPGDDALWARLHVLHFPNGHPDDADLRFKQSMMSADNLKGVLRWLVEGARDWYALEATGRGILAVLPDHLKALRDERRKELDTVQQWLDECCIRRNDLFAPVKTFYASYKAWCEEGGHQAKGNRMLTQELEKKGIVSKKEYVPAIKLTVRCYIGLGLLSDAIS